jgi:hypothetical protein
MSRIARSASLFLITLAVAACSADEPTPTGLASPELAKVEIVPSPVTYAVIGDVPYGASAFARFPTLIGGINDDPDVQLAVHVGDIKSGSTECTDEWFEDIADDFATFSDPLVYSIGDNEWTDCHRANNGGYEPLGRLAKLREIFFANPGTTLGAPMSVDAEPDYPENQRWSAGGAMFATFHVIGSNNGLEPWFTQAGQAGETPEQTRAREQEVRRRQAANIHWLEQTFAKAQAEGAAGVVLFLHADLWHPDDRADGAVFTAHEAFVARLAQRARSFGGPVLIVSGDSHDFRVDAGVPWFELYGVEPQPNVTQIIVDRSIEDDIVFLKLTVDASTPAVFSWSEVTVP